MNDKELINIFQSQVRDKSLPKYKRIFAYGRLRQLRYNEFKVFKVKSKYLFNTNKNDDHYVLTIKNDGKDNFIISPIMTHLGTKKQVLAEHNCLEISGSKKSNFSKSSHLYPKLRSKKYHDNSNIKKDILKKCNYYIDLQQINEIENFLYDNKNKKIAKENRDLKNRWRERRKRVSK